MDTARPSADHAGAAKGASWERDSSVVRKRRIAEWGKRGAEEQRSRGSVGETSTWKVLQGDSEGQAPRSVEVVALVTTATATAARGFRGGGSGGGGGGGVPFLPPSRSPEADADGEAFREIVQRDCEEEREHNGRVRNETQCDDKAI
jgi:hypothetical protein